VNDCNDQDSRLANMRSLGSRESSFQAFKEARSPASPPFQSIRQKAQNIRGNNIDLSKNKQIIEEPTIFRILTQDGHPPQLHTEAPAILK